jgi:hypothetical protein
MPHSILGDPQGQTPDGQAAKKEEVMAEAMSQQLQDRVRKFQGRVHKFTPTQAVFIRVQAKLLGITEDQVKGKWDYRDTFPEWMELEGVLLKIGGESVIQPSWKQYSSPYPYVPALVKDGYLMSGPVKLKEMRDRQCHVNVRRLLRQGKLEGIGYGYALSLDFGVWVEHSWGLTKEGILETTSLRDAYFGLRFQGERADTLCGLG